MLNTFSPLWEILSGESNYNPNVAYCFLSLGVDQRILGMELEGVRAFSHCMKNFSSGLCYFQCTLWTRYLLDCI